MTLRLLALNMAGHGTAPIANMVHLVLTARSVRRLIVAIVRRLLLTAVMIIQPLVPKLAEHGTGRLARCPIQAVPAARSRTSARPDGFFKE